MAATRPTTRPFRAGEERLSFGMLPEGMAGRVDREPRLGRKRADEGRVVAIEGRAERVERRPVCRRLDRSDDDGRPAHSLAASESSAGSPSWRGVRRWISAKASITRWTSSGECIADSVTRMIEVLIGTAG